MGLIPNATTGAGLAAILGGFAAAGTFDTAQLAGAGIPGNATQNIVDALVGHLGGGTSAPGHEPSLEQLMLLAVVVVCAVGLPLVWWCCAKRAANSTFSGGGGGGDGDGPGTEYEKLQPGPGAATGPGTGTAPSYYPSRTTATGGTAGTGAGDG